MDFKLLNIAVAYQSNKLTLEAMSRKQTYYPLRLVMPGSVIRIAIEDHIIVIYIDLDKR